MLIITNVNKTYTSGTPVLQNINLTIAEGEIVCLLGPSGCGKTTLLRIVAGLEQPDSGQLTLAGRDLRQMPVHQRNFGLMFQEFALFPHRTVAENVAFGLRMAGQNRDQIRQRVQEMLALVNLAGYDDRSIFALSGGERQRVALARSLAPNPRLLMLDEPLGSLDRALREELMVELRTILKAVGVTALYVTHDQQEAFAVADRLVVMHQGQIEQIGSPPVIYDTPASAFVARFLGFQNLLPLGQANQPPALAMLLRQVQAVLPTLVINQPGNAQLLLRPDAVRTLGAGATSSIDDDVLVVRGTLLTLLFRGSFYQVTVELGEEGTVLQLRFDVPTFVINAAMKGNAADLQSGQPIWLHLDPAALAVIT
jgi:ABC-type Fe3+/spermidine/putrescine transport system ATPase subunit